MGPIEADWSLKRAWSDFFQNDLVSPFLLLCRATSACQTTNKISDYIKQNFWLVQYFIAKTFDWLNYKYL